MESLWNSYGLPMELLWSNTQATRQQRAERAGAGRWGLGELAELRSLVVRLAGAEGFAGWPGRGRKEAAKAKVPARGFDWAPDGIPDSNFSDEPDFQTGLWRPHWSAVSVPGENPRAKRVWKAALRPVGIPCELRNMRAMGLRGRDRSAAGRGWRWYRES